MTFLSTFFCFTRSSWNRLVCSRNLLLVEKKITKTKPLSRKKQNNFYLFFLFFKLIFSELLRFYNTHLPITWSGLGLHHVWRRKIVLWFFPDSGYAMQLEISFELKLCQFFSRYSLSLSLWHLLTDPFIWKGKHFKK